MVCLHEPHGETGLSTKEFIDHERAKIAKRLLKYSEMNVSEIADLMEFDDAYCFSKFFRRITGIPPGKYAKNHRS